jgi:hypothetical protein
MTKGSATATVVGAAVLGATAGLAATALAAGSVAFGLFGAVGGAVAAMIGALATFESAEA